MPAPISANERRRGSTRTSPSSPASPSPVTRASPARDKSPISQPSVRLPCHWPRCGRSGPSPPTKLCGAKVQRLRIEFVQQRLCVFEIGRAETLGKPAVDRREQIARLDAAALAAPKPGKARGGAQFPELGPLLLGDAEGFAIQFLGGLRMPLQ